MLRLTALCPPDQTEAIVAALQEQPDTQNVLCMRGVEVESGHDMVTAFVPRGAIDVVLERLRALRRWGAGELTLLDVDLVVREDDDGGEEETIGWERILDRAQGEARLTRWYLIFMAVAGLLAAIGLVADLPIVIVGAMSVSPDLAPVNAIAVALVAGAMHRMLRGLRTLAVGLGMATLVAYLAMQAFLVTGLLDRGAVEINQTLVTFVSVVDPFTVIVALAAGVAAMVAFVTDQGTSAVGVAISVTTIPAASYLGIMLAGGFFNQAAGSLRVLIVNILCVMLAQAVTLILVRLWRQRRLRRQLAPE
jgi:uncharacterized hydrophobic protein (TIGR00271 family)